MSSHPEQMNVLIVDDQPEGLVALDAILGPLGQRVVRASSGREALRAVLREDFALVLLDVVMPDIDGFETARLMRDRQRSRDTPIIFLTALNRGEMPSFQAYSLGAVDYILKPIEPEILRSKVNVFIELARRTATVRQQAEALREAERREHQRALAESEQRAEEQRMRAREALLRREIELGQQERQWLESVLNTLPTPLVMMEPVKARVLFENHAARRLPWSATFEGAAVRHSDRLRRPLEPDELPAARAATGARLEGAHVRWECQGNDGAFLVFSEEVPGRWGHDATTLMMMLDVTQLTRIEENLQAAVRARDTFVSVASHELRTPLTSLTLQIQRLRRAQARGASPLNGAGGDDPLSPLGRSVSRLQTLVDRLLDASRIAAGRLELERAEVDLSALVNEVLVEMSDDFSQARCPLAIDAVGPVVGLWDRSWLEEVVANLVANALKYAPGKPVVVTVRQDGEQAVLSVRDEGIGIAPDDQERIFRRFERAASGQGYGGLGLGLWIVQEIVSGLGGSVGVRSAPGEGSTFTVRLPASPAVQPSVRESVMVESVGLQASG